MSFALEAIRDKPVLLHPLDGAGPYTDNSGYGRTATVTGTPGSHPGLCAGVSRAPVVGNSTRIEFNSPVFAQGKESTSFSLSVWVHPLFNETTERRVLGTSGTTDGITIKGTKVAFVTKYLSAPAARAEYDLQQIRAVHAVGVHTADKNSLYINGQLVAEVSLTEEQQADQFVTTDGWLYSGSTSAGQPFAINGVALFPGALTKEAINRHFIIGRRVTEAKGVVEGNGGEVIPISLSNADIFLDQWWSTAAEWQATARMVNTAVISDRLVPTFDDTVSQAGTWTDTFVLAGANANSIYGVTLNWDGEGAVVEVSLDGTSWESVTRGVKTTTITEGFNPTDKVLLVRISFPGGIVGDTSYVDNLNVVGLRSGVVTNLNARTLTLVKATQEREYPMLDFHEDWGVEIANTGTLTISADPTADPGTVRTVEVWAKRTGTPGPSVSVAGTTYANGIATGAAQPIGQWFLFHVTAAANVTTNITVTGPAQVGQVALYETALNASQVAQIYAEYFSASPQRIRDTSTIGVQESAVAVKIYAYDWTIAASG